MTWLYSWCFILRQSGINREITSGGIETVHGWLLGDSAYGLRTNLMTPITSPSTPGQRRYNRAFLKVRQTIEFTFGIWKSRWSSMDKTGGTLCNSPEKNCKIIIATMVLHNMCIDHGLLTRTRNINGWTNSRHWLSAGTFRKRYPNERNYCNWIFPVNDALSFHVKFMLICGT